MADKVDLSGLDKIYNKSLDSPKESLSTDVQDYLQGAAHGIPFINKLGGLEQEGLDLLQRGGHALMPSVVPASPVQVNQQLKEQGITGDVGPTSEEALKEEGEKETGAAAEAAQKRSPWLYGAGELGTSIPVWEAGSLGLAAPKGAGLIEKAATNAINYAPIGALVGASESKGSVLQNPMQVAKDALSSAETAGLVGTAVAGLGKVGEAIGDTAPVKRAAKYFKMGQEGVNLGNEEQKLGTLQSPETLQNPVSMHSEQTAQEVYNGISKADDYLGERVGDTITKGTQQGVRIQADPTLADRIDKIFNKMGEVGNGEENEFTNRDFSDFFDMAKKLKEEGLNPQEAQQFRNELGNFGRSIYFRDQYTASEAFQLTKDLTTALKKTVPGYADAAERLDQFRQNIPETILSKDNPIDVTNLRMSGMRNVDTKLLNNIKTMVRGMYSPTNMNAPASFSNLLQGLQKLNNQELQNKAAGKIPQTVFDAIGMQPQDIENYLKTNGYKSKLIQDYTGIPDIDITKPLATVAKASDYIANKAGVLANKIGGKSTNPVLNTSQKLYSASDEALKSFSNKMAGLPNGKEMSQALDKALDNRNLAAKNAILFSILQNPDLRKLVESDNLGLEQKL